MQYLPRLRANQLIQGRRFSFAVTLLASLSLAVAWTETQLTGETGDQRSIQDGIYTAEQANRGRKVFGQVCSQCHNNDDFVIDGYMQFWSDATVFEFVDFISSTMPEDNPGALPQDDYIDVVAYLFGLNGIPTGGDEMASDPGALSLIRIEGPYSSTTGS